MDPGPQLASELQLVEQLQSRRTVPLPQPEVLRDLLQVEVAHQGVEPAVADHVAEVLTQRLALLAGDLVGVGDHVVEAVVVVDPLGGVADPDTGHARQVVGGLPHQRGDLGVALGRYAVLVLHRLRGHPGQLGHAAHRVEHGRPVAHQLEGVAVAAHDQHVHVVGHCLGDEGADDVVGLVAGRLQERDVERVEEPLDQRQLAAELVGGLVALRLVLRVLLGAERLAGHVERDRHMGRLLVAEHVGEHRGEPVDRVGVLTRGRREVLDREREECAIDERVAVQQQEAGAVGGDFGHPPMLAVAADSRMAV